MLWQLKFSRKAKRILGWISWTRTPRGRTRTWVYGDGVSIVESGSASIGNPVVMTHFSNDSLAPTPS